MKELNKPVRHSFPLSNGQRLNLEVAGQDLRAGVAKKGGARALDRIEVGVPRHFGPITLERSADGTLRVTDGGVTREISLGNLAAHASEAELHLLRNFALGLSQAANANGAPVLKSERPAVQALLDDGFAVSLSRLVKGEAGVRLDQLPSVSTRLETMALTPEERARLRALPSLMTAPGADWSALYAEERALQERSPSPEDLRAVRGLILGQLAAAGLPKGVEQALLAHEVVTKETPTIEDLLRLLSGELFLPRVSGAIQENINKAARGAVWIEGTETPQPHHAEAAAKFVAEAGERIPPEARAYWTAALTIHHQALALRGPHDPSSKLLLLERLGAQTMAEIHQRFDKKGDGGLYAEWMIAGYAAVHPKGVKSLKEHLAVTDTETITHAAYGFNALGRAENAHALPGFTPEVVDQLVQSLRFGDFVKLVDTGWQVGFQGLLAKEGVQGLIALAKRKDKAELVALAEAAKVEAPKAHAPKLPPADPALVATVDPPPLGEVANLAEALRDGSLSKDDAAKLHAIVERYLIPDAYGRTATPHYSYAEINRFWSGVSDLGPVLPTAQHLGARRILNAKPEQIAAQMRDLLALGARGEIVDAFVTAAKAKPGSQVALGAIAQALAKTTQELPALRERYQRLLDGFGDEKTRYQHLFNDPSAVAALLAVLSDPAANTASLLAALNQVEYPYRSLESQVHDQGSTHTLRTAVQLGGGSLETDIVVHSPRNELRVKIELPGLPRYNLGAFAELQTFGEGGARFSFGAPVQGGSNRAAELIGARLYAEVLTRGAEHALEQYSSKDHWRHSQLEGILIRSAIELSRLPAGELHLKAGAGRIETPAQAFAAIAQSIGFDVQAPGLDAGQIKLVLAQVCAAKLAKIVDHQRGGDAFTPREGSQLLVQAFEWLAALPAARRQLGDPSPAQTMARLGERVGYDGAGDLKQPGAWERLEARALAGVLAQEAGHWMWLLKHYADREREPTLAKLGAIADKLAVLSPEALAETPPGAKQSTAELLTALAQSTQLASDGSPKGIIEALRAHPSRIPIGSWLEDPLHLGSQVHLSPRLASATQNG